MKKQLLFVFGAALLLAACNDTKKEDVVTAPEVTPAEVIVAAEENVTPEVVTPEVVEQNSETAFEQAHTAQNSLDWAGIYQGTLPCADCGGINVELTLSDNGNYLYQQTYLETRNGDQTFDEKGSFTWNNQGQVVTLEGTTGGPDGVVRYFVGENVLFPADKDGKIIEIQSQFDYNLHKVLPQ